MFCIKCGQELPEGAAFCLSCGAKLAALTTEQVTETPAKAANVGEESEITNHKDFFAMQLKSDMTNEQVAEQTARLQQVFEVALEEKNEKSDKIWARLRTSELVIRMLKRDKYANLFGCVLFMGLFLLFGILSITSKGRNSMLWAYMAVIPIVSFIGFSFPTWSSFNRHKQAQISDLYVSNIKFYGTTVQGEMVSIPLNSVISVKVKKKMRRSSLLIRFDCGLLILCARGREYKFLVQNPHMVSASFDRYLLERENEKMSL